MRLNFGTFWKSLLVFAIVLCPRVSAVPIVHGYNIQVTVAADGSYSILAGDSKSPVLNAGIAAKVNHVWVRSSEYPHHRISMTDFHDSLGGGRLLRVTFTGLRLEPELTYSLRLYNGLSFGDIEVSLINTSTKTLTVQALRLIDAIGKDKVNLDGPQAGDRILSDSYSEDDPNLRIYDLGGAPGGYHRAVGSQLIYNRQSQESLFLGALTSHRFLTMIHLQAHKESGSGFLIGSLTVDSTGTTEAERAGPLDDAPDADLVELSLPVRPGKPLSSEQVMFAAGKDYHHQLEEYGRTIRLLHHARVNSKAPMGWWSWTAYYGKINQNAALANAEWLAQHLKNLGFDYFHLDEGYDYARGEYTTPNRGKFPKGMTWLGRKVTAMGLRLGIWTAPFEVSEKSKVYRFHKDWLVRNAEDQPLQVGGFRAGQDRIYVLDATNPAAQDYLRQTYQTIAHEWGARYIKLDFMETTAAEGHYHQPDTTALEAERIGLKIFREAVGNDVLLDKDGSPMLVPVGIVDEGRISVDTGHSFWASQETAPGIAARYYMNRNFFVSDPDAFTVSRQSIFDHSWPDSTKPLTLSDAQVSIVLAAVAGGMYEIGDNLEVLAKDPDRIALIKNPDLLKMARLGRAAVPLDLMNYRPQDRQPSIFLLHENLRQSILAIFNWTEAPHSHTFTMTQLGVPAGHSCQAFDALNNDAPIPIHGNALRVDNQPPHSVRLIKLLNASVEH